MASAIAFRVLDRETPALEVRVNFGVFAGRNATQAEIDELAGALNGVVASFAILAEERHEFANDVESSVRQIVIEIAPEFVLGDIDLLSERILARAEQWAAACIHERSELGELGSEL
jgi:flagellar biosynthesis/type III secretory pathway protein FliH